MSSVEDKIQSKYLEQLPKCDFTIRSDYTKTVLY